MTHPAHDSQQAVLRECRRILEHNSKSFALAARLLAPAARDRAAAVYAYCRRVDDAIDDSPREAQAAALTELQQELTRIYEGVTLSEPALRAFQAVIARCNLPSRYPCELIEGMAMDVRDTRYATLEDLLLYCHRVAGVVGLMMCHVFGLTRDSALVNAAHLGIAMQLTNICRDVKEDWELGRLYLPRLMLEKAGARNIPQVIAGPFPRDPVTLRAMQDVIGALLAEADKYYASAQLGMSALPIRAGLAVAAASALYHAIGQVVVSRDCDPTLGRAVVPTGAKLGIVGRSTLRQLRALPRVLRARVALGERLHSPQRELTFPGDILHHGLLRPATNGRPALTLVSHLELSGPYRQAGRSLPS